MSELEQQMQLAPQTPLNFVSHVVIMSVGALMMHGYFILFWFCFELSDKNCQK